MGRMSVSLDEQAQNWVREQAGDDAEAFVNALIHRQARKQAEDQLGEMLEKARKSGIGSRTPQQIMADVKADLIARGQL